MPPLRLVAVGTLIVAVNVFLFGIDVLIDPLGWLVVILGLSPLVGRHAMFQSARIAAIIAFLTSVAGYLDLGRVVSSMALSISQLAVLAFLYTTVSGIGDNVEGTWRTAATIGRQVVLVTGLANVGVGLVGGAPPTLTSVIAVLQLVVIVAFAALCWLTAADPDLGGKPGADRAA